MYYDVHPLLKYTIQGFLVYSQSCAINTTKKRRFSSSPDETLYPLRSHSRSGNHCSFCLYGFAYSGHVMEMESHNMWPFVSGIFSSTLCFKGSSLLYQDNSFS